MAQHDPLHKPSTPGTEQRARKQPVSERRILANRKNALLSTGPKTERGKCAVFGNAITHGILAREVVITAGDGEESQEEFDAFCRKPAATLRTSGSCRGSVCREDYSILVETLTSNSRRKRRNTQTARYAIDGSSPRTFSPR
jgi:hypothetical protein